MNLQGILGIEDDVQPLWHSSIYDELSRLNPQCNVSYMRGVLSDIAAAATLHSSLSVARAMTSVCNNDVEKMRLFIDGNLARRDDPSGAIGKVGNFHMFSHSSAYGLTEDVHVQSAMQRKFVHEGPHTNCADGILGRVAFVAYGVVAGDWGNTM